MLIRATIVLLAVLNLGVAAWWLWRPMPVAASVEQPVGVPRLVLLEEIPPVASAPPVAPQAEPLASEPVEPSPPARETRQADPAPEPEPGDSGPLAGQPRCEDASAGGARGWRVYLPPAADLAAAEATAARIAAAGFGDYLVLRDGESANGIALGMYSTEASAQRRSAALRAAGFAARCARIPASTPA